MLPSVPPGPRLSYSPFSAQDTSASNQQFHGMSNAISPQNKDMAYQAFCGQAAYTPLPPNSSTPFPGSNFLPLQQGVGSMTPQANDQFQQPPSGMSLSSVPPFGTVPSFNYSTTASSVSAGGTSSVSNILPLPDTVSKQQSTPIPPISANTFSLGQSPFPNFSQGMMPPVVNGSFTMPSASIPQLSNGCEPMTSQFGVPRMSAFPNSTPVDTVSPGPPCPSNAAVNSVTASTGNTNTRPPTGMSPMSFPGGHTSYNYAENQMPKAPSAATDIPHNTFSSGIVAISTPQETPSSVRNFGPPQMSSNTFQDSRLPPTSSGFYGQVCGVPPMNYNAPLVPSVPSSVYDGSVNRGLPAAHNMMGGMACGPPMSNSVTSAHAMPGAQPMATGPPGAPGMLGPPTQHGMQPQKPRLDPNLMPSVVQVVEEDRSTRSGPFPTGYPVAEHPPLITTEYFAQDQGNCNPKYMRSTIYVAPSSSDLLKTSQIPFAVAVSPFATIHPNETRPPIVDLGELGPVRCDRCKAYMCPFMEFQDGGRRFKCPFCLASSNVEDAYFAHLDHSGRRTDIQHRPEQFLGSYEFVATKLYCKNNVQPKEPAFIFMLDVSYTAVRCGLVSLFCKNVRRLLRDLPRDVGQNESTLRIGFATYDQTIHFYNLKNSSGHPEMLVVGDICDVFVPIVDGFLVTLGEAEKALERLLIEIEKMFSDTHITETILGPVVQAGLDALKCADRAGKLFIFNANLPTFDAPGKLKNRDDRKLLGSEKEKTVLQPGIDFYTKLGEECVKAGCAVDLFLFPNSFVDVASLSPICTTTGGSLYKYHYFEVQNDGERFLSDLSHDISREIVFDAMMRVRSSTGLRPLGFIGSFYMDNTTDMEMGVIDCDKAMHIELRHDDKLPEGNAYIQTAILFTSCSGQRRIRILNMALSVSSDYNRMYLVADPDCLVSFIFKQAEQLVREKSPKEMREAVTSRCAQMLATYRERCSEQAPLGQLILPECLKLLPLFANCIIKNDAVSGGSDVTVDDRAFLMQMVPSLRVEDTLPLLYPSVFLISAINIDGPAEELSLSSAVRCSYDNLLSDQAYLIFNGLMMFIWIGLGIPQQWLHEVFNCNSVSDLNIENNIVPERDNTRSRVIRHFIQRINAGRARSMKLFIIRQHDAREAWMKKFLVEDRTSNMLSYVDYLCNLHREIRSLLS